MQEIPVGSHLVSPRAGGFYTHHGIYIGEGRVVHYSGYGEKPHSGPVAIATLAEFDGGFGYSLRAHPTPQFTGDEAASRAMSRVGEDLYGLFSNNCEHFCNWAIEGDHASGQIDYGVAVSPGTLGSAAGMGGAAAVALAAKSTGFVGAAATMKALAVAGTAVGGGVIAGLAGLSGVVGFAAAAAVNRSVLAQNDAHDDVEDTSRAVGRSASYGGAAVGTAGSIAAIGAAGVPGLSAAGITSGLAGVGGLVGGGMGAGIAVTVGAPVAAAIVVGYGSYRVAKFLKRRRTKS